MGASEVLAYIINNPDIRLDPLRNVLSDRAPSILEVTQGDGSALLEIYSIRTEIASAKQQFGENYRDLEVNLRNQRPRRVTVLHVGNDEKVFLVFIDSDNKQILGVIPGYVGK
jgi:hypothetical protein